jgi:MOSC domain-containing protein YiiM
LCVESSAAMISESEVARFGEANRPGAYLRVKTEGELGAGDEIDITHRPSHGVTIAQVSRAILLHEDQDEIAAAAQAPELPANLSRWMQERAA